jgi:hypothetical protein
MNSNSGTTLYRFTGKLPVKDDGKSNVVFKTQLY